MLAALPTALSYTLNLVRAVSVLTALFVARMVNVTKATHVVIPLVCAKQTIANALKRNEFERITKVSTKNYQTVISD